MDHPRSGPLVDMGKVFEYVGDYFGATAEEQDLFWDLDLDTIGSAIEAATVFVLVWNTARYYATDGRFARRLNYVFQMFYSWHIRDGGVEEEIDVLKRACPYLQEIFDADDNWTVLVLPGDSPTLEP
jgi:hypothetical protein